MFDFLPCLKAGDSFLTGRKLPVSPKVVSPNPQRTFGQSFLLHRLLLPVRQLIHYSPHSYLDRVLHHMKDIPTPVPSTVTPSSDDDNSNTTSNSETSDLLEPISSRTMRLCTPTSEQSSPNQHPQSHLIIDDSSSSSPSRLSPQDRPFDSHESAWYSTCEENPAAYPQSERTFG